MGATGASCEGVGILGPPYLLVRARDANPLTYI
jgi:hypothetical protein